MLRDRLGREIVEGDVIASVLYYSIVQVVGASDELLTVRTIEDDYGDVGCFERWQHPADYMLKSREVLYALR